MEEQNEQRTEAEPQVGDEVPEEALPNNEHFSVVGVQIGQRRNVVRNLVSTTIQIGDQTIDGYRCQLVDPAIRDGEPPEMLDVVIPSSSIALFIIQPEPFPEEEEQPGTMGAGNMGDHPEDPADNGAESEEERIARAEEEDQADSEQREAEEDETKPDEG